MMSRYAFGFARRLPVRLVCTSAVVFAMESLIVACILESANVLTLRLRYRGKACQTWSSLKMRAGMEVVAPPYVTDQGTQR